MPASEIAQHPSVTPASVRKLLLSLGAAMVAGGAPVYDVEEALRRVAWKLGHQKAQVSATPTSVLVSLVPGEPAALQVVPPPLRLDQSAVVNDIRRRILSGEFGVGLALARLSQVRALTPRFGTWGSYVGNMAVSVGICLIVQPALLNVAIVAGLSLVVTLLLGLSGRFPLLGTLLQTVAAFVVSLVVLWAASHGWIDGTLRTIICPIAVLMPGATLATGIAELAGGMMISGTSRLVYGGTQLLLATLGVVVAAMALGLPFSALTNVRATELGWWVAPVGLAAISCGLVLAESLPLRLMPWALTILVATFTAQNLGQLYTHAAPAGTFLGAMVAAYGASAAEATRPNVPRLVVFLPSFWLLVPGTLGLIGITQLGTSQAGMSAVINVINIVVTIALGLLVGTALARPLYRLARLYRRRHATGADVGTPVDVPATPDDLS